MFDLPPVFMARLKERPDTLIGFRFLVIGKVNYMRRIAAHVDENPFFLRENCEGFYVTFKVPSRAREAGQGLLESIFPRFDCTGVMHNSSQAILTTIALAQVVMPFYFLDEIRGVDAKVSSS